MKKLSKLIAAAVLVVPLLSNHATAGDWPDRPVRIVVGYAPGGNTDMVARALAEGLSQELKQSVVVDNRPGAAGLLAAKFVANSKPDGYTYFLNTISLAISPLLFTSAKSASPDKFLAVSEVATIVKVLLVNSASPIRSVDELVAFAKANTPIAYSSTGVGSANHMMSELFAQKYGLALTHVPYKGAAPEIEAMLAGEIVMDFEDLPPALPHIKSGKLRPLMVIAASRHPAIPDVPSATELGLADVIVEPWDGIVAPKDTPIQLIRSMDKAIEKVVASETYKKRLTGMAINPAYLNSERYSSFIASETVRWSAVIKKAGITLSNE